MKTSVDRILTTHTGSLPRPTELTQMMFDHQDGKPVDPLAFEAGITEAVDESVAWQVAAGVDVVSDGEQGKVGFNNYVRDRLTGFGGEGKAWSFYDLELAPEIAAAQYESEGGKHIAPFSCVGEIVYVGLDQVQRDIDNFKAALGSHPATDAFLPTASPGAISGHFTDEHYGDYETYLTACADAMKVEYAAITSAGLNIQLDCPDIPTSDPRHGRFWTHEIIDRIGYQGFVKLHLEAIDYALADIAAEQVRMHLCWANYAGPHHLDGPLADLIQPVLDARPMAISFEAANPRHEHEWEVFESISLPDDKVIIPGVIDTLTSFVEHPRLVAQRLERFANLVGKERVIAGTDCGFGTFVGFGSVGPQVAALKLQSMASGAQIVSDRLW